MSPGERELRRLLRVPDRCPVNQCDGWGITTNCRDSGGRRQRWPDTTNSWTASRG